MPCVFLGPRVLVMPQEVTKFVYAALLYSADAQAYCNTSHAQPGTCSAQRRVAATLQISWLTDLQSRQGVGTVLDRNVVFEWSLLRRRPDLQSKLYRHVQRKRAFWSRYSRDLIAPQALSS